MSTARKSLMLTVADGHIGLMLQLLGTVIISRLLTPEQVGVFSIAALFAAIATTMRDFGVAEYLIQLREPSKDRIRAALTLNILVSGSVALILFFAAPYAAAFFREPGVGDVMRVQCWTFALIPFAAVTQAWFRRELNYWPIALSNLAAGVAGFISSIVLAYQGYGYMSLAWSGLIGVVVSVSLTNLMRPRGFPLLPGFKGILEVFQFGKFASLIYVFAQVGKGAPDLAIGRVLGAAEVGIFSRAYGPVEMLNRMLLRPVLMASLPYFANQGRTRGDIGPGYASSVSLLTAVGWPFLAVIAFLAFPVVRIVYGVQWLEAVPLAQILLLACAIELLFLPSREALLAVGDARRASLLQLQIVAAQCLGLLAVLPYGLAGAAAGMVFGSVCGLMLSQWYLRALGPGTTALLRACLPSLVLTVAATAPLVIGAMVWPVGENNFLPWCLLGLPAAACFWLLALWLQRHVLWFELTGVALRILRPEKPAP